MPFAVRFTLVDRRRRSLYFRTRKNAEDGRRKIEKTGLYEDVRVVPVSLGRVPANERFFEDYMARGLGRELDRRENESLREG